MSPEIQARLDENGSEPVQPMPGIAGGDAVLAPQNREDFPLVSEPLDEREPPIDLPLRRVIPTVIAVRERHHERRGDEEQERNERGAGHCGPWIRGDEQYRNRKPGCRYGIVTAIWACSRAGGSLAKAMT